VLTVQQDIKLGEGITIHKIDTVLSFGAPLQLFTYRSGYLAFNAAVEAAQLGIDVGLTGADIPGLNISDYTIFVPTNEAFESIGSVLESADLETLQSVLTYHIIPNNVIFSPSLGNVTVPSLQGTNLTFTVLPDGSAWVNQARIVYPNTILYNGIAHVIDRLVLLEPQRNEVLLTHTLTSVLAPGDFDRASLSPSAPASERLAFPNATVVQLEDLPFTSVAFAGDTMTYMTTPVLLQTVAAVATSTAHPTMNNATMTTSSGLPEFTGAANALFPGAVIVLMAAFGTAASLV
jgi:hypothetical protein